MIPGYELESSFSLLNNLKPRRDRLLGAIAQWQLRLCFFLLDVFYVGQREQKTSESFVKL